LAQAPETGKWTLSSSFLHAAEIAKGRLLLKFFKRAVAALGLATVSIGAAPAPAPQPVGHPALWEVSDPDTTIYLFGTIHLLPANYRWESPKIEQAVQKSDKLYVETIVDPDHPQGIIAALNSLGYKSGLPPLANRIAPSKRPLLEAAIAKTGIPRPAWDRMKTWTAAFILLGVQYTGLGLAGDNGPELTLRHEFAAANKPVGQLESNAEQLGFFNSLPDSAQRALLEGAVEKPETMGKEFDQMLKAWARGDVSAIATTFNEDLSDTPALMDALLKQRNATWKGWIEQRLASPGTVMLAVGAGHLAGPDSVVNLLKKDGYRVRRIQ
jgi:uncharacterized protein